MVSIRRRRLIAACSAVISKLRNKRLSGPSTPDTSSKSFRAKTGSGAVNGPRDGEFEVKRRPYQRKKNNTLSLRGVYFKNMKWQSAIKVGKKQVHLGTVSTKEDAAHLYDRAAYMCGRIPNFELSQTVKRELDALTWDEFLDRTKAEIASKKARRRIERHISLLPQHRHKFEPKQEQQEQQPEQQEHLQEQQDQQQQELQDQQQDQQQEQQQQQQQQDQQQELQQQQQQQQQEMQPRELPPLQLHQEQQLEDESSICKFSVEVQNFQCELLAQS